MTQEISQAIVNKGRADKFLLVLTLPPAIIDLNTEILSERTQKFIQQETLQFSVWGVVVPTVSVPAQNIRWGGQPYNVTGQSRPEYPPIQINFTIDNYYNNYWVLWKWLDIMNKIKPSGMDEHFSDNNTNTGNNGNLNNSGTTGNTLFSNKFTDYQTTLTVYGLDEYNHRVVQFDYFNSFITDLGEIRYNYRDETELESNFSFVFNQMEITLLDDGEPAGL